MSKYATSNYGLQFLLWLSLHKCIKFTDISARTYVTETEIFVIVIKGKYLSTVNLSALQTKRNFISKASSINSLTLIMKLGAQRLVKKAVSGRKSLTE
jgi:hypothetical protein